jgi:hypothetical protein
MRHEHRWSLAVLESDIPKGRGPGSLKAISPPISRSFSSDAKTRRERDLATRERAFLAALAAMIALTIALRGTRT